uniref:Transmembrane protein 126A n=1 Tax=Pogona vitticeps TaxID=103695 RepID=A0A6J0V6V4_9SAUR|nr:transmembrane protein 126A [Pogona vitticeps]
MIRESFQESGFKNILNDARRQDLEKKFEQLPNADKYVFQHGPVVLSVNSSFCGLLSNTLFRRVLHVTQGRFSSTLPMVFIPLISTMVTYEAAVRQPLMEGDLNCSICAFIRGGLTGAVVGCLHPVFIALPLNACLAARYNTSPMPSKENMLKYWKGVCYPVLKKMRFAIFLQFALGAYLGSRQHAIYLKMLKMPGLKDPEELGD